MVNSMRNSYSMPIEDIEKHWLSQAGYPVGMKKICENIALDLAKDNMAAQDKAIEILRLFSKWIGENRLNLTNLSTRNNAMNDDEKEDSVYNGIGDLDLELPDDARELQKRITKAANEIWNTCQIDGSHHRLWTLNEVLRLLVGEAKYEEIVTVYESEDENGDECEWDKGIAP